LLCADIFSVLVLSCQARVATRMWSTQAIGFWNYIMGTDHSWPSAVFLVRYAIVTLCYPQDLWSCCAVSIHAKCRKLDSWMLCCGLSNISTVSTSRSFYSANKIILYVSPSNLFLALQVLYIILFLFADAKSTSLLSVRYHHFYICLCGFELTSKSYSIWHFSIKFQQVSRGILNQSPLIVLAFISTLVGWAVKQVTNVIQVFTYFPQQPIAICTYLSVIMAPQEM
jgi:hypothetical protein